MIVFFKRKFHMFHIGPGNLYIRSPPNYSKKHMNANHNMIGYLAIYSHVPSPSIVI